MNAYEKIISAVETAASNPKTALLVSAAVGTTGFTSFYDLMKEGMAFASLGIAVLTGAVVLTYQILKTYRLWKAIVRNLPEPKDE